MALKIGIDVGNSDTKTQHTTTPSGYNSQKTEPQLAEEWIYYDGNYYYPTQERFSYSMDKTTNGHALILSLFGIAKEILYIVENSYESKTVDKQQLINRHKRINLGVGLPPGHMDSLGKKTNQFYKDVFQGKQIDFTYRDKKKKHYDFHVTVENIKIYPQDFMAVWKNQDSEIATEFDKYYIIGIGGYTVDIILVKDNAPVVESCRSLGLGTIVLYEDIIKDALKEGADISADAIERVLRTDKKHILSEETVALIRRGAHAHSEAIIDACVTAGVKFEEAPVVYCGGGALLLEDFLTKNKKVRKAEFLRNVNANAERYAKFL